MLRKRLIGCLWLLLLITAVLLETICVPIRLLVYLGIAIYRRVKYKKTLFETLDGLFTELWEVLKDYYRITVKLIKWFFKDEEIDEWE